MRGNQKNKNYKAKWSPEFAYAIGLLTTDGSLSKDGRHFDLTSKNIEQIRTFKKCLGIDNKISRKTSGYTEKKNCYHIQFSNVRLHIYLCKIGLMPNKTKKLGALKIPDIYFFHFLRGHLDGDGNIQKYQDSVYPNSQRVYIRFYSSSLTHLKWIRRKLRHLINIKGHFKKFRRVLGLSFAKKESLKLLPKIYPNPNVPCLKRKYKIVESLLIN